MKITKNFHLKELIISSTAERLGIENKPNGEQLVSLSILTQAILQPIRDEFGVVSISSGLRVPDLNKAIGGSKDSSHCKGEAADFECYSVSNYDLCSWIIAKLKFDDIELLLVKLNAKPIDIVRTKEDIWKENFKGKEMNDDEIINVLVENPKLMERPIVTTKTKAVIGRPPENVLELFN